MSKAVQNRLKKELDKLIAEPVLGSKITFETEDDLRNWIVDLNGPADSPYSEGTFKLKLTFPDSYPFKAPEVVFSTSVYHPNIKLDTGEICLDVFASTWAPTQKVSEILSKIGSLLKTPSTSSPLEADIANEYQTNYSEFERKAKDYTLKYAIATKS